MKSNPPKNLLYEYTYRDIRKAVDLDFIHHGEYRKETERTGVRYVKYNPSDPENSSHVGKMTGDTAIGDDRLVFFALFKTPLSQRSQERGYAAEHDAWYQTIAFLDMETAMAINNMTMRDKVEQMVLYGDVALHCSCLAGDTKIPLLDGRELRIDELQKEFGDTPFWVYSTDENGDFVPKRAVALGETGRRDDMYKITLDNGESFECTSDHLIRMRDGRYKPASELEENDSLMPLYRRVNTKGYEQVQKNTDNSKWELTYWKTASIVNHESMADKWAWIKSPSSDGETSIACHHKSGIKSDNSPENLEWLGKHEHWLLHASLGTERLRKQHKQWDIPEKRAEYTENNRRAGKVSAEMYPDQWKRMIENGTKWNREHAEHHRENLTKLWEDSEMREHIIRKIKEHHKSEDYRELMSEFKSKWWSDPENKARVSESLKRWFSDPRIREESHDTQVRVWKDEDLLKKHSDALKKWWSNPDNKKKRVDRMKNKKRDSKGRFNHSVVKIEKMQLENAVPVYDISVEGTQNFLISPGIIVHNCPSFKYWGYWAITSALGASVYSQGLEPKIRNPQDRGIVCKHMDVVLAVVGAHVPDIVRDMRLQGFDYSDDAAYKSRKPKKAVKEKPNGQQVEKDNQR